MKANKDILFLIIDLFCGAGGVTTGFELAKLFGKKIAKVIMCVNHDALAIASHYANYPDPDCLHFTEDIRTAAFRPMVAHLKKMRKLYPNAKIILWASAECTNLSNAKGGKSRNPDSRTLSENLYMRWNKQKKDFVRDSYIQRLNPDYVMVENVREIMAWGPVIPKVNLKHKFDGHPAPISFVNFDKKTGKIGPHWIPEDRNKGKDYQRWVREVCDLGYRHEHRLLNAADFGAYTSRLRYFAIFAKPNLPIVWPNATHAKKVGHEVGMFGNLKPWMPVRDVLDLWDEGHSIFTRKTNPALRPQDRNDLEEKTLERIYAGMVKHVAGGSEAFLVKHMGNNEHTGINNGKSLDDPCITLCCQPRLYLATPLFISKYYGGKPASRNTSLDKPCGTITTENRCAVVSANFLTRTNGGDPKDRVMSTDGPINSITTSPNQSIVSANFLTKNYSGEPQHKNITIEGPAGSITTKDSHSLVSARFLSEYNGNGNTHLLNEPAGTIPTKDRFALVKTEFLDQQYGASLPASLDNPAGSITVNPKFNLVQTEQFMVNYYSGGGQDESIDAPTTALTTIPKQRLISVDQGESFLTNPGWFGNTSTIDAPSPTIIARQDKSPVSVIQCLTANTPQSDESKPVTDNGYYLLNAQLNHTLRELEAPAPTITVDRHYPYLVVTESGELAIETYPSDSPATVKIKQLMAAYGIIDVKMRMLKVIELKRIQGFPENYILKGAETHQKKFIGNSVVKDIPMRMAEALGVALKKMHNAHC